MRAGLKNRVNAKAENKSPRRPPFQFSLMGLMVVMFAISAAAAPGYYMFRTGGMRDSWLIGMLMMLAGPMLVMTLLSVVLSLMGRGQRHD